MSVLIVGSTALDSIKTPKAENPRLLGGSASHAAVAASFFGPVNLVGVVGDDFPRRYIQLYERHGIDLEGLQRLPGKTFHWSGEYEANMNNRRTLLDRAGRVRDVHAHPAGGVSDGRPSCCWPISPRPRSTMCSTRCGGLGSSSADTMDLWLNVALPDLLKLLKRLDAFVLNDSEAQQLTGEDNVFVGPARRFTGWARSMWSSSKAPTAPSCPGRGACSFARPIRCGRWWTRPAPGDSFVGGMMGYLAAAKGPVDDHIRRAMIYGSVVASFCCEGFGLQRTTRLTRAAD